jgi:hypothetical protein
MSEHEQRPLISEADITSRGIERRTFLGRFGMAVALMGVAGIMPACGGAESGSSESDADAMEASDAAETAAPDSAATATPDSTSDDGESESDASDSDQS